MKKLIIKAAAFLLIFCILFLAIQEIIRYKDERPDDIDRRYEAYLTEKEDSIDVFFIGSSPMLRGVAPMLLWEESGITSVNFGMSRNTAMVCYYQLIYALQTQTPKLVVFDFCGLFADRKADDNVPVSYEQPYRKITQAIPSPSVRAELILQIEKDNENQDSLTYFFPLLRYHTRWNELTESDFKDTRDPSFKAHEKGGLFEEHYSKEKIDYDPAIFESESEARPVSEYAWNYYRKALNACAEKNISVAVVAFPKEMTEVLLREYRATEAVCAESGIHFYNMNSPAMWEACELDAETDFYDSGHINANGTVKVTKALAERLQKDYQLPDHRDDALYSEWNDGWDTFYAEYKDILSGFGY